MRRVVMWCIMFMKLEKLKERFMNEYCRARFSILAAMVVFAAVGANAVEPIRWFNGVWDERGAPQGKLLTDNGGWWGERPYKCDFLKLREKALAAFDSVAAER